MFCIMSDIIICSVYIFLILIDFIYIVKVLVLLIIA